MSVDATLNLMFAVRTLHAGDVASPESVRLEAAEFDLEPRLQQGRAICNLFAEYLAQRPGEFREILPFLNKQEIELQWAAAAGGAAFASFFHSGQALAMAVLLSGTDPESDEQMIEALKVSVLGPMFGEEGAERLSAIAERPGVLMLVPPHDSPELNPTVQLLLTALASVYFRAVIALAGAAPAGPV